MKKNFVSLKINAEKGEGTELTKKYGVRGFPTMLVVDPEGDEVDRIIGFRPPDSFVATLKLYLEGKSFGAFKKRAEKDPTDFEAVLGLGKKYGERGKHDEAGKLYRQILAAENSPRSSRQAAEAGLVLVAYHKSRDIEPVEKHFEKEYRSDAVVDLAQLLFFQHQRTNDSEKVIKAGDYLLRHGPSGDANFLNNYAWYLATHDKKLKQALKLAKKAVKLSPKASHIVDTLAEAYRRNGMHGKAVETAKRAVELATSDRARRQAEERLKEFEKAQKEAKKARF